jgi:pilus assembly protein CpaF
MDLLQALNTGHRGALSTIHANSPVDAVRRVETLALSADLGLPYEVLRAQVATALDLILHLERGPRGERRAVALAEVIAVGGEGAPGSGSGVRELWSR